MKLLALFAFAPALALTACASFPSPRQETPRSDPHERISIYLGQRELDEGDWAPVEEQGSFAIEYATDPEDSFGWEFGLAGSADSASLLGIEVDGLTTELYGGVVQSFGRPGSGARPYLGGGVTLITAEYEALGLSDDDSTPALYLHAGVAFDIAESAFVGIDIRKVVGADVTLFGVDADADYEQVAVVLGWGF